MGASTFFRYEHFSARGRARHAAPSSVNLGPHHISETTRATKSKFYTHLTWPSTLFGYENFFARGVPGALRGVAPLV